MAKKNKSLGQQLKEANALYEDEQRTRDEQHQLATKAEKRANELALEIEDIRAQLEQVCTLPGVYRTMLLTLLTYT